MDMRELYWAAGMIEGKEFRLAHPARGVTPRPRRDTQTLTLF